MGIASLFSVGLSPLSAAQAAYPSWSSYASQAKRPQFRPWSRAERQQPAARWRPQGVGTTFRGAALARDYRRPAQSLAPQRRVAVTPSGASRRYAPAKTPLQGPGPRFRPDARQDVSAESPVQEAVHTDWGRSALDSQFRPAERRRKPVYQPGPMAGAAVGQPLANPYVAYTPPPFPVPPMYGGYWPRW